jgi:hypothetical protein
MQKTLHHYLNSLVQNTLGNPNHAINLLFNKIIILILSCISNNSHGLKKESLLLQFGSRYHDINILNISATIVILLQSATTTGSQLLIEAVSIAVDCVILTNIKHRDAMQQDRIAT